MRTLRRIAAPLRLAGVRLAHRAERVALVALGVGAGAALLAAVLGSSLDAQDRSLARRIQALAPDTRAVHASWFGVPAQTSESYAALSRTASAALLPVVGREPVRTVLFREATLANAFVGLGAVDGLSHWVRLSSGRFPHTCRPSRCEVVQIRGRGALPDAPGLRIVRVGRGDLVSTALFGDAIPPARNARAEAALSPLVRQARRYHRPPPPPVVLAEGVGALVRSPQLASAYRAYGWVVGLRPGDVHPWSVDSLVGRSARARSSLEARSESFDLAAPEDELLEARASVDVAGRRLLLLGGEGAVLLVAFAALAAARLRRDVDAARTRLTWLGTPRWQPALLVVAEATATALVGGLAGWLVGAAVVWLDADAGVARHSVLSGGGLLLGLLLAAAAAAVLVAALTFRPLRFGGVRLSPVDLAAIGALLAAAIALARGEVDPSALLAQRGTGAVLLLLPALLAFAAAVAVARALRPALRAVERAVPERMVPLRLAALSLARSPGAAGIGAAFLAVSAGLALFAASYRATLLRGERDQAAFAVPADYVLREDLQRLITVPDAVSPDDLRRLGAGARARPVARLAGGSQAAAATGVTVLGLEPSALPELDGWRSDFAARAPADLASRIDWPGVATLRGPVLPPRAGRIGLTVRASGVVRVSVAIQTRRGGSVYVDLGATEPGRVHLAAGLPEAARGGRIVAVRLDPPPRIQERGAEAGHAALGTLALGPLDAGGRPLTRGYTGWAALGGARLVGDGVVRYSLTNQATTYVRPQEPTDGKTVPAIVSPRLAAAAGKDGLLPLELAAQRLVVRVVATARRFPGARGDFVVADRDALLTSLNAAQPGSGAVNELWIDGGASLATRLRRPPFDVLALESRSSLESELRGEPVARAAVHLLAAAGIVALGLALAGLLLGTVADLRDERGELFDLEAQGAAPAALRTLVRLRGLIVAAGGVVGGLLLGAVLALVVVRLVALTAGATRPEPPLTLQFSPVTVLAGLGAFSALAALLVAAATAGAFRTPVPERPAEALH